MTNFTYLASQTEYALFAQACLDAEATFSSSYSLCVVGCRKALELAIQWVYSADSTMVMPYKDNLQSLIHEPSFRYAVDKNTWGKLPYIAKLGNESVHTANIIDESVAVLCLSSLFEFIQWIEYCYGIEYSERTFDKNLIPKNSNNKIIELQLKELELLKKQISENSINFMDNKIERMPNRDFVPEDLSEFQTRKKYIDLDLKLMGWVFGDDCLEEVKFDDMDNVKGQKGFADYVLFGKDGKPLAVIEAKRTSKDPIIGKKQVSLYADCLERKYGVRPMMFCTNGFDTLFWDDESYPMRSVSSLFSKSDLQKLMARRSGRKNLVDIKINESITDRHYQKNAINACCEKFENGFRKALLVMATGTGKTRTASSLTDVLSRGGYIKNVLFLADRTALVSQARDDFHAHLPNMSLCNLLSNKDDKNARIVFSTYPTILNAIDNVKNEDGQTLFTPAHFDLIIIDEAHRSIFKKYKAIFQYFDSLVVGLTATPKTDVDRNTYDFFEVDKGVPTFAYDYETARDTDKVLVPYYNIEVKTKFMEEGIKYDELSDDDKERFEEDFTEDNSIPEFIPPNSLNKFVFNQKTVDMVLTDLMTKGVKIHGGDKIGKTIIFAQTNKHAKYIVERFYALYPQYKGGFISRVSYDDTYSKSIIADFKMADKNPQITVSVDMLDTGIDVPEVVNLVFFKKVRSKTKFWQMIGRGTRLCKNLNCTDYIDGTYKDKNKFVIFDYCCNFEYFRGNENGFETKETQTVSESIFSKQVKLIAMLNKSFSDEEVYVDWKNDLIETVHTQISNLNTEIVSIKLQRKYIDKFSEKEEFLNLDENSVSELVKFISPLVYNDEYDEFAKKFDSFMYGFMLAFAENSTSVKKYKTQLKNVATMLASKTQIVQIKNKITEINNILEDEFWDSLTLVDLEKVRVNLRNIMKFIVDNNSRQTVFTNLDDVVVESKDGDILIEPAYDFEDYKIRVNKYIEENKDETAIWKLRNNIALTSLDYQTLSNILTKSLGTEKDYQREFGDTPFGLLVRKIAKLEVEAAKKVFSEFITEQNLNSYQINFVNKIVDYIVKNGYLDNNVELMNPPFDKPQSFVKLFDSKGQKKIMALLGDVKRNAEEISA